MIGVQGRANTRRIMKIEKPRPLKITSIGDQSIESVLSEMDLVTQKLNASIFDQSTYINITSLCENLKIFGSQLESVYKDQLDRCYVSLRNGCRDDRLSLLSRYRLLEVIELRAMNWQPNENLINYYQQKLAQMETEEMCIEEANENDINNCLNTMGIISPTTPSSVPMFPGQYPSYPSQQMQQRINNPQPQSPQSHIVPNALPLLNPGELLKSSGKFSSPIRVPGKNHFKDEIVIRNADSGKVMGLKGRRVHMIEELSETVISLQRVAPGARERLVQITGGSEENISQARQLIEETIRRNASPIRSEDSNRSFINVGSSCSSVSSRGSDEMHQGTDVSLEDNLVEYRYTVIHDNDTIRITGNNLEFVKTAKLILDEYFSEDKNSNKQTPTNSQNSKNLSNSTATVPKTSHSESKTEALLLSEKSFSSDEEASEISKNSIVTVLRQPLIPSSSKEIIESVESSFTPETNNSVKNRRILFAKTNEEKSNLHATEELSASLSASVLSNSLSNSQNRITYSRDFLLGCANSPICRMAPENWTKTSQLLSPIIKKEIKYLDPSKYLTFELLWSGLRAMSVADEEESSNANDV